MSKLSQYNGREWIEIKGEKGDKPVVGVDFQVPSIEEIIAKVPPPKPAKDGSPDSPDEVVAKINAAKKKILISQIKGLSAILEELDRIGKFPMGGQISTRTGSITKRAKLTPTASGANITLDLNALPLGYVEILGVFRQGQLLEAESTSGWTKSGATVTVYSATTDESFYVDYNY